MAPDETPTASEILILLVGNDPLFRVLASLLLSRLGHRVVQACDGWEGLHQAQLMGERGETLDLIITDLRMEPMSGRDMINKMRILGIDSPVLVATDCLDEALYRDLQGIGRYELVMKPLTPQDLMGAINKLCIPRDDPPKE